MKIICFFLLVFSSLVASPFRDFSQAPKIAVQNSILAKVNGKTISMMDIKKKMDMVFHQYYPDLIDSPHDRLKFYEVSWRRVLMDLIDNELIIADALDKEVKITDGDIRELMEERFGPNVLQTLDRIDVTYDEAWKMLKNELIVQRMSGWFIYSKAASSVTPQDIRNAYKHYLQHNPPYSEWHYQVVSIRSEDANDTVAKKVYETLSQTAKKPEEIQDIVKALEEELKVPITLSGEFKAKTQDLSDVHRKELESLAVGSYSKPSRQINKQKQTVYRIFYLLGKNEHPAPSFESLSLNLRNELQQKAVVQESENYLGKLRKYYGFALDETIPEDLHPFSIQ